MREWHAEAAPLLKALMRAEDNVLAQMDHPGPALTAACDQLDMAADHCEEWTHLHPCPDAKFRTQLDLLIRSCAGIGAMLSVGLLTDPEYRERVDDYLKGRISTATGARAVLRRYR